MSDGSGRPPVLEAADRVPFLLSSDTMTAYGQESSGLAAPTQESRVSGQSQSAMLLAGSTAGGLVRWTPNASAMTLMMEMGITEHAAGRALYNTGNESAELAASWVFENLHLPDVNEPFVPAYSHAAVLPDIPPGGAAALYKMVFVVNTELRMGVGKVAAQVGHATLGLYKRVDSVSGQQSGLPLWDMDGGTKIVLSGVNTDQLLQLQSEATTANISTYLVRDAGLTQIQPGSVTVLGLFGQSSAVDNITGSLKLL